MELTERQKGFLYRAAELERQGMGIMAAPGFQEKMAAELERLGLLRDGGWMQDCETGREDVGWRITLAGVEASGYRYPLPSLAAPPAPPPTTSEDPPTEPTVTPARSPDDTADETPGRRRRLVSGAPHRRKIT